MRIPDKTIEGIFGDGEWETGDTLRVLPAGKIFLRQGRKIIAMAYNRKQEYYEEADWHEDGLSHAF